MRADAGCFQQICLPRDEEISRDDGKADNISEEGDVIGAISLPQNFAEGVA